MTANVGIAVVADVECVGDASVTSMTTTKMKAKAGGRVQPDLKLWTTKTAHVVDNH